MLAFRGLQSGGVFVALHQRTRARVRRCRRWSFPADRRTWPAGSRGRAAPKREAALSGAQSAGVRAAFSFRPSGACFFSQSLTWVISFSLHNHLLRKVVLSQTARLEREPETGKPRRLETKGSRVSPRSRGQSLRSGRTRMDDREPRAAGFRVQKASRQPPGAVGGRRRG